MIKLKLSGVVVEFLLCFYNAPIKAIGKIDEQVGQDFEKYGELKNYTVILEKSDIDIIITDIKEQVKKTVSKMQDIIFLGNGNEDDIDAYFEKTILKDYAKVINQFKKGETIN